MASWIYLLLGVLAGTILAMQPPINAQLRVALGSPYWAAFFSFLVGAVTMSLVAAAAREPFPALARFPLVPWWVWVGGALGAFYVTSALVLAPRLGVTTLVGLIVLGQVLASLVIDHYGLLGAAVRAASLPRLLGAGLLVAGVAVVQRW